MTKMTDTAWHPALCANAVTRPLAAVRSRAGSPDSGMPSDLYRQLVDLEIGRASEHGARWWSRRLVEVFEEAGLVRLDR
ncbi:MAG TPA: hypothetical protein VGQ32_02845 [Thermoanaerobaculia bacterium]|nr:hypothetical protein [Thermoanaerobaculia bacterium]